MRAAVLESVPSPLAIREIPIPPPGPAQVLLRVIAMGNR